MYFRSLEYLNDIEKQINESHSLPIFKGYKAINRRGVEKLIEEIYANLPVDVKEARIYLDKKQIKVNNKNKSGFYDLLKTFETTLYDSIGVMNYVFVNVKEIENLLDRIYSSVPSEIIEARKYK